MPAYNFKVASEDWEFEQIHKLNYQTFVEEIPQHEKNHTGMLVDKFHNENTYLICLSGQSLLGMLAIRSTRPFSLDMKLDNLDSYLPPGRLICEVRLLALAKQVRGSRIFQGLMNQLFKFCIDNGFDFMIISATVRQLKLYTHLGFRPFGPLVGTSAAQYQPMYLPHETFINNADSLSSLLEDKALLQKTINFLPGPVTISESVIQVFSGEPVSHRSDRFQQDFQNIKRRLCELTGAQQVEILLGSGTLANDVIAAQLSLGAEPGLVLSNGEFGERLIDHAVRAGLNCELHREKWGEAFNFEDIKQIISANSSIRWLWAVHCETSTGVLNNLALLKEMCRENGIRLCMDCISSIGTVPLDFTDIHFASGVSGKALGSYPGLSMVFFNHDVAEAKTLPRYLDLGYYIVNGGIPFTHSSNLVYGLGAALLNYQVKDRLASLEQAMNSLRKRLRQAGFSIIAKDEDAAPSVITLALPKEIESEKVGNRLDSEGFLLSYRSSYLKERNWLQICLMGNYPKHMLDRLTERLKLACGN